MSDRELEDLRARVRRGDAAARLAYQRALVRAGQPVERAWEGLGLVVSDGLRAGLGELPPAGRAQLDLDLGGLDGEALLRSVGALSPPLEGMVLAGYAGERGGRWLIAAREGDRVVVDLVDAARVGDLYNASESRGRWHAEHEAVARPLLFALADARVFDAVSLMFDRLGEPLTDVHVERRGPAGPPPEVSYEEEVLWTSRARRVSLVHRWEPLVPIERRERSVRADVHGLPGGARLALDEVLWSDEVRRYSIDARRGRAARIDDAWLGALEALARRDAARGERLLVPEAWRARADEVRLDPRLALVLELGRDAPGFSKLRLVVGAARDGVRWAAELGGRLDAPGAYGALRLAPGGPLPEDASLSALEARHPSSVRRSDAHTGALELVFAAVTGVPLPASSEARDDARTRARAGEWVGLEQRADTTTGRVWHARVQHERGAGAATYAWLEELPSAPWGVAARLTLRLVGPPAEAAAARDRLAPHLRAQGWSLST
jgi:hypothetical protein